jgi:DNA-binding transcriptional regulator YhcF (GntR family)
MNYKFIPIYKQVKNQFLQDYKNKPAGTKVPTELELAEHYGVSKMTMRQAMMELAKENVITRIKKKGTFIADPKKFSGPKTVGIIYQGIGKGIFPIILESIEQTARDNGYELILANSNIDFKKQAEIVNMFIKRHIDGVVFVPIESDTDDESNGKSIKKLIDCGTPQVLKLIMSLLTIMPAHTRLLIILSNPAINMSP